MANIHVLAMDGSEFTAAFHLAIPNTNNTAGVNWRTAVLRNGYGTTVLPDGDGTLGTISASEKSDIQSGAVVEIVETVKPADGAFLNGAALDAAHTAIRTKFLADFQARYARYGTTR